MNYNETAEYQRQKDTIKVNGREKTDLLEKEPRLDLQPLLSITTESRRNQPCLWMIKQPCPKVRN